MDTNQLLTQTKTKLDQATKHFEEELKKLRTGRAHPSMLDSLIVSAYGSPMPLKAVASIATPESQMLQITPFDTNNLEAISNAIRDDQSLDLTPSDDGRVVRVQLPPMTSENRQAMVKVLNQKLEEAMIAARNIRHEGIRQAEEALGGASSNNEQLQRFKKQVDDLMASQKLELEKQTKAKEQEILNI